MAQPTITARNTTTPDSADLRITVQGAETEQQAREAAYELMATSRYTVGASIYEVKRDGADWICWAEY